MKKLRLLYASAANFTLVEQLVHTISTGDYSLNCISALLWYDLICSGFWYSLFCICSLLWYDFICSGFCFCSFTKNISVMFNKNNLCSYDARTFLSFFYCQWSGMLFLDPDVLWSGIKTFAIHLVNLFYHSLLSLFITVPHSLAYYQYNFLFHPFFHILLPINSHPWRKYMRCRKNFPVVLKYMSRT